MPRRATIAAASRCETGTATNVTIVGTRWAAARQGARQRREASGVADELSSANRWACAAIGNREKRAVHSRAAGRKCHGKTFLAGCEGAIRCSVALDGAAVVPGRVWRPYTVPSVVRARPGDAWMYLRTMPAVRTRMDKLRGARQPRRVAPIALGIFSFAETPFARKLV